MYSVNTDATSSTPPPAALSEDSECRKVCRSHSSAGTTATIYGDPSAIAAMHGFPTYNCTTGITAAFPQCLSHAAVPLSNH